MYLSIPKILCMCNVYRNILVVEFIRTISYIHYYYNHDQTLFALFWEEQPRIIMRNSKYKTRLLH